MPRRVSFGLAGVLVLSGLVAVEAGPAKAAVPPLPALQQTESVPGTAVVSKPAPAPSESQVKPWTPSAAGAAAWPAAGTAEVDLAGAESGKSAARSSADGPTGDAVKAGGLPVRIASAAPSGTADTAESVKTGKSAAAAGTSATGSAGRVRVQVADRAAAQRAGVDGVLLGVGRTDAAALNAPVTVELDYSGFRNAYGGGWSSRLTFVALPGCALTTPEAPECRTRTPLVTKNNARTGTLTAQVDAAPAASAADPQARSLAGAGSATPTGGTVLAAVAGPSGPQGDYKATSLAPSGTWQGGGAAGDFSWSYPLELPTSLGGPGPNLGLSYSSSAVDGRTSASQAQASWIGDGWDLGSSFIERTFPSCADDKSGSPRNNPQTDTGDVCQGAPIVAMSLNGGSTQLVLDDATKKWVPEADDGSKVELLRGAPNGDNEGEYWVVTTMDGTKYYFGQNHLPGWAAGKAETKSAWTMPVVGNNPGEDCYQTQFKDSFCTQAYRWNLDLVVDPRGNAMAHYYETETNSYGSNVQTDGTSTNRSYVRGGWLLRTEYGLRADNLYAPAPAQVDFTVAERCVPLAGVDCAPGALTKDTAKNWPDVPFDQNCNVGEDCKNRWAPTFWSRKRLADITTRVRVNGQLRDVDTWTLTHDFPMSGDGSDRALWLAQIQRTAKNGTTPGIATPPVLFGGKQLPNRVDNNGDGSPPYFRYRIDYIHTETGQSIGVVYAPTECSTVAPVKLPSNPETNGMRCYPVIQEQKNPSDPNAPPTYKKDWFHKHLAIQVREEDRNGNSPNKVTNYEYVGTPAWAYDDDNELTKQALRTWNQWRGYERVRTRTGEAPDVPSLVENLYFRGMDGDKLPSGKRSVEITDGDGGTIHDTEDFAGQVRETLYYNGDGGALLSATIYTPWVSDANATRVRTGLDPQTARVKQTVEVASRTALSDNRGWRRTKTKNTFDNRGLQLTNEDYGDTAKDDDNSCTRITYAPIDALHILNLVGRTETVAKLCGETPARPGDVLGDQLAHYDAVGNSTGGEILDHYEGTTPKYVGNGSVTVDNYGRPKSVTDRYGVTTTNTYIPAAGEIVAKIESVNNLGHKTVLEVDPGRGTPLAQTDLNGRKTVMQYDQLGRTTKVWTPDRDPATKSPDAEFSYDVRVDAPVVVTTKRLLESGEYRTTYELYDGMLRLRQTQQQALGGGRVIADTFYNSRGEVWKENAAHYNSDAPAPVLWASQDNKVPSSTRTYFDGLGRATDVAARKLGEETWRTTTTYGGDWVAVDPPAGTAPTKAFLDAQGRKTKLQQYPGDAPTGTTFDETTYTYDKRGALNKLTDPSGTSWEYEYDLRGRLVTTKDPDKGTTTMTYDDGDRLLTTTDQRGKTLAFAYDVLGRPTETHEGSLTGPKLTQQTYDTVAGAVGLPASSSRFVNGNEYKQEVTEYDTEYRPTATQIVIPQSEGKLAGTYAYTSGYGANTGLPLWTKSPAAGGLTSDRVTTEYNGLDLPQRTTLNAATFVDSVTYSPLGSVQRTAVGPFGKQLWSTYEYDEQTGANTRVINDREVAPQRINDVRYTRDVSGNILKVTDAEGPNPTSATTDTQCFSYDYLRRLTDAWTATDDCAAKPGAVGPGGTPQVGGPSAYWTSYTYRADGSRLTEVQHDTTGDASKNVTRDYTYLTGTKSHQLEKVTTSGAAGSREEKFLYNEVGATTKKTVQGDDQILDWDSEGHLAKSTSAGRPTDFVYDASGQRLIRRDPDNVTLYLPGTELKLNVASQKVTGTRSIGGAGGAAMVRTNESGSLVVSYLLGDQNGTANTSVDAATQQITRRKFTPFGDTRGTAPSVWPGEKGFVGGTVDKTTGFVHLGAREYDPTIGRFISVDPIMDPTDPQQMQAYSYANNSPVTFSDPTGLWSRCYTNFCRGGPGDTAPSNATPSVDVGPPPAAPPARTTSDADVARARFLAMQSKLDYAAQVAKEVLKDMSGYNDIMSCIGGSVGSCAMLAAEAAFWFAGKAKKIFKALKKVKKALDKWSEEVSWARGILKRADDEAAASARYAEDLAAYNKRRDDAVAAAKQADSDAAAAAAKQADADAAAAAAKQSDEAAAGAKQADKAGDAGGSCARNSFVPGTLVLMADGTTKPIEEIQLGDEVLATDPEAGTTEAEPVAALIIGNGQKNLVEITVDTDGAAGDQTDHITATDGHPFWVPELAKWARADELVAGNWLRTSSGTYVQITAVAKWTQQAKVHNLTVASLHTYYVLAGATPVLVHNISSEQCQRAVQEMDHVASGVLDIQVDVVPFASGGRGSGGFVDDMGDRVPGMTSSNFHHVEMQAAAYMRRNDIRRGVLYINHPEGICQFCNGLAYTRPGGIPVRPIEDALPSGAQMWIYDQNRKFLGLFTGNSR
ncbi:polymorphic toxin-type HINT domain-containing protein [Uniformispora flossi]|uniref:polymorphic toxin-type HINT domain-containing protein n=1 Tax=Uniformispora flossi TaxID=3390723 RepID=UPI003C2C553A